MLNNHALFKIVSRQDKELFARVIQSLQTIAKYRINHIEEANKIVFSCHSVCRALAESIKDLVVIDGYHIGLLHSKLKGKNGVVDVQLRQVPHSWLRTPDGAIIDPYPVGFIAVNPILIVNRGRYAPNGAGHYVPRSSVTTQVTSNRTYRRETKTFSAFVQKALESTEI